MSDQSTIYKLVNPEFTFEFAGEQFPVRKASLDKAIQYQAKAKEFADTKDPASDLKLAAFSIWLVLKDHKPEITEQQVLDNTPADLDVLECLSTLGFISPKKAEEARKMTEAVVAKVTGRTSEGSSSSSPTGSDGHQTKSEI